MTLPNGVSPGAGGEINQMPRSSPPQSTINGNIVPPRYLPQFPFGHPELIHQHPFLPYNLAHLRTMPNGLQHNTSSVPSSENMTRLSPVSSRPSSSSPPSTQNTSIRVNSNSEEESDDEQIDVVRSAFVPILRPSSVQSNIPDSTTVPDRSPPAAIKSELKAPSSRKPVWRPY